MPDRDLQDSFDAGRAQEAGLHPPIPVSPDSPVWHVATGGKTQGPVSLTQLTAMVRGGKIPFSASVWNQEMAGWTHLSEVPELAVAFAPPPLPPRQRTAANAHHAALTSPAPGALIQAAQRPPEQKSTCTFSSGQPQRTSDMATSTSGTPPFGASDHHVPRNQKSNITEHAIIWGCYFFLFGLMAVALLWKPSRKPADQYEPGTITADYLPHKVGALAHYEISMYSQPASQSGIGMHHQCWYEDGGLIKQATMEMWDIKNGAEGQRRWVGSYTGGFKILRLRVNGDFVEIGSDLEGVGFVWEPYLKLGAKVGDHWEKQTAPRLVSRYSVERFGDYDCPVTGRRHPTVTVREDTGSFMYTFRTYARGIGLIHAEIYTNRRLVGIPTGEVLAPRDGEVYKNGELAGKHNLFDSGVNLTPSERMFFDATSLPSLLPSPVPPPPLLPPFPPPSHSNPQTVVQKAEMGVGQKGRDYGTGPVAKPAAAYFAARERIAFDIQIPHAMNLFKSVEGRTPKSHEEFMEKIVRANQIQLPKLPEGHRYVYDPKQEQLMVERPK
jgi:hypothetical protein